MNVELERFPTLDDFSAVLSAAERECFCTEEQKAGLIHGDEEMCKPCAARQVLNGVTSLADRLERVN